MATDLGQGLIPEVDNINTFETTLEISAFNNIFTASKDSFRSLGSDEQFLGVIDADPIFGKTDARMFFQPIPYNTSSADSYKNLFKNSPNKRYIDSVVLILNYVETYGDTTAPQTIQVSEIGQSTDFKFPDSSLRKNGYSIYQNNFTTSGVLGSKVIIPNTLKDSVKVYDDSTGYKQLRIKLNNSFGQRLLAYDTIPSNDAYSSDSAFKSKFKGFALQSIAGGNAIMGFNLINANTKLAVYYQYENLTTPGDRDTAVAYFRSISATANYIGRDYNGTQVAATSNDNTADNLVYIQNTPGTYATLKIPGLDTMSNKLIHLAELDMSSVYDTKDTLFGPPAALMMDMYNDSINKFTTLPYSFTYNYSNGSANYANFGSYPYYQRDMSGNSIRLWRFNLTNYVQKILTKQLRNKDLRLYAAPYVNLIDVTPGYYFGSNLNLYPFTTVSPGKGRVRLGGGNHPTQKMKLRVVYSKI